MDQYCWMLIQQNSILSHEKETLIEKLEKYKKAVSEISSSSLDESFAVQQIQQLLNDNGPLHLMQVQTHSRFKFLHFEHLTLSILSEQKSSAIFSSSIFLFVPTHKQQLKCAPHPTHL